MAAGGVPVGPARPEREEMRMEGEHGGGKVDGRKTKRAKGKAGQHRLESTAQQLKKQGAELRHELLSQQRQTGRDALLAKRRAGIQTQATPQAAARILTPTPT